METQQYSVLIYSKYSSKCTEMFNFIQNNNIALSNVRYLCIDNETIRKLILKNKKLNIHVVPSFLRFFNNGTVEVLDEIDKIYQILSTFIPLPLQKDIPVPPPAPMTAPPTRKQHIKEVKRTKYNVTSISDLEDLESPTELKELEEFQDQDEEVDDINKKMPLPPRIRKGTQDFEENSSFFRNTKETEITKKLKNKDGADPHGTIALARELAQGREETESQFSKQNKKMMHFQEDIEK